MMNYFQYMDAVTLLARFGSAMRRLRQQRGLTQAALAARAGIPRLKVIQVEKGDSSVSIGAYAQIASALGAEFTLLPAKRPTLDEVRELMAHG
jgi:transcriptional regulator with XRE-family HTH domain